MTDHTEDQPQHDREQPKYVADASGRSWSQALRDARMRTARQREADAQLREAWGLHDDASPDC